MFFWHNDSYRENIRDRAQNVVFEIKSCIKESNITPKLCQRIFDQLIKFICLYGAEKLGAQEMESHKFTKEHGFERSHYDQPIEHAHIPFCKHLPGVFRLAINVTGMGELGCYPLDLSTIQFTQFQNSFG